MRAGWQVGSNEAQIPCVYLPLCALESTGQEGKKKVGDSVMVHECECMSGWKKKMPSAIPVCLLLWLVVLRLHAAWIMLELQPVFPKEETEICVTWPGFEWGWSSRP